MKIRFCPLFLGIDQVPYKSFLDFSVLIVSQLTLQQCPSEVSSVKSQEYLLFCFVTLFLEQDLAMLPRLMFISAAFWQASL
jgi:hypothetical protein